MIMLRRKGINVLLITAPGGILCKDVISVNFNFVVWKNKDLAEELIWILGENQ